MRFHFSKKLTLALCSLVAVSVAIPGYLLHNLLKKQLIDDLTANLTRQASIVASQLEPDFMHGIPGAASQRVKELEKICDCRVTFIRTDGKVMEDSDVPSTNLSQVENHADRQEVKKALAGEEGHAVRLSRTVNEELVYAAVPLWMGTTVSGVIRLALPLTDVNRKLNSLRKKVTWITLGMMVVAWFISFFLARSISRPVQEMSSVAKKLAQGHYEARVPFPGRDELGQLGATLNSLATTVESQIKIIFEEKSYLAAVLSHMTDGVVVVDATGRVVLVNPALATLFELDVRACLGKLFLEVLRESKLNDLLDRVIKTQKILVDEVRTFSNEERIFEAHGVPMTQEGKFVGVMLVLHDITEIRRLEQVRRDFIANVSHELRTPLSAIKGFAETLLSGGVEDTKNRMGFLKSIETHGNRMASLVDDLLDLTAIESGHRKPTATSFSIDELIENVLKDLSAAASKKKIEVKHVRATPTLTVQADRSQIQQVLVNLIENALKYTPEGGRVEVAAKPDGEEIAVSVRDSGIGIPSKDVPRIFERFYRVDKARSREMGGTGLGLSIVKHIIEAHAGTVRVESQLGQGSCFTFCLPVTPLSK